MKDEVAMNLLRLESRLDGAVDYLARLQAAMVRVDAELWPQAEMSPDLVSLMTRLNQIADRVQEWKKSSARCGADIALSLVRVHCKEAKEDKLAALKVVILRSTPSSPSWTPSSRQPLVLPKALTSTASAIRPVLLSGPRLNATPI